MSQGLENTNMPLQSKLGSTQFEESRGQYVIHEILLKNIWPFSISHEIPSICLYYNYIL